MITIELLKNHPDAISSLAKIWHELLGQRWAPDVQLEDVEQKFYTHLNEAKLPLALVALANDKPIGMCALRENDGIREELKPWLGSLIVDKRYQNRGIGKQLMDAMKTYAKNMGFSELYLLTFDLTLPEYYQRHGWKKIGIDVLKSHPVTVMSIIL